MKMNKQEHFNYLHDLTHPPKGPSGLHVDMCEPTQTAIDMQKERNRYVWKLIEDEANKAGLVIDNYLLEYLSKKVIILRENDLSDTPLYATFAFNPKRKANQYNFEKMNIGDYLHISGNDLREIQINLNSNIANFRKRKNKLDWEFTTRIDREYNLVRVWRTK